MIEPSTIPSSIFKLTNLSNFFGADHIFYFIAAMNKFAFPFLLTLFSSNVWADDITQSLQQSKQQFADLQSQINNVG